MESELTAKLEQNNMSIPDHIDKNSFVDIVNLWD